MQRSLAGGHEAHSAALFLGGVTFSARHNYATLQQEEEVARGSPGFRPALARRDTN
jgi:hypothetical protein